MTVSEYWDYKPKRFHVIYDFDSVKWNKRMVLKKNPYNHLICSILLNWTLVKSIRFCFRKCQWDHHLQCYQLVGLKNAELMVSVDLILMFIINSLGPNDAIWRWSSWSTLVQVTACCLTAPSRHLNQCWLIISKVLWHSSEDFDIAISKARLKITF